MQGVASTMSDKQTTSAMNTLGIILARAGSVGLTGKHLRSLAGKPVICHTFDHARAARLLTRICVTTDCPVIRRMALGEGFVVIDRPGELATSEASVQDVMLHALHEVEARDGAFRADAAATLYGNVALRPTGIIDRAIEHLRQTRCDSVRSFCPVGKWQPNWMSRLEGDRVIPLAGGSIHRRQDLTPTFLHDGAVVAVSRASMLRGEIMPHDPHAFFGVDRRGIETEMGETIEIDHIRDLYWAEAVLRDRMEQTTLAKAG
jgi:CMP-N-acetylneuraminic acid synthetase